MVVVGLGTAGTNIANKFKKWDQYEVISLEIPEQRTAEDYENNTPDVKNIFEDTEDEVWFILCGSERVAGCTLKILEQIQDKKIKILYIFPDLDFAATMTKKRNRVVCSVLQEYCRSGLIDSIYLIDNKQCEEIFGAGPIMNYFDGINDAIASLVHYSNIYENVKPVFGSSPEYKQISRIRTFGVYNIEKNEKNMLFLLDNPTQTCYIYNITRTELQENNTILKEIKKVTQKNSTDENNSSFVIYSTEYDKNFCHVIQSTHFIQEIS